MGLGVRQPDTRQRQIRQRSRWTDELAVVEPAGGPPSRAVVEPDGGEQRQEEYRREDRERAQVAGAELLRARAQGAAPALPAVCPPRGFKLTATQITSAAMAKHHHSKA
jgi:hypothetical protein